MSQSIGIGNNKDKGEIKREIQGYDFKRGGFNLFSNIIVLIDVL